MVLLNVLSIFLTKSSLKLPVLSKIQASPSLYSLSLIVALLQIFPFSRLFSRTLLFGNKDIIPDPGRHARTTRSSTHLHPFQVTLPNPRTLAYTSSFTSRTSELWSSLLSTTVPESYNLSFLKSNLNKLDLVS